MNEKELRALIKRIALFLGMDWRTLWIWLFPGGIIAIPGITPPGPEPYPGRSLAAWREHVELVESTKGTPLETTSTTPGYHPEYQSAGIEYAEKSGKMKKPPQIAPKATPTPMPEGPQKEAVKDAYKEYAESRREPIGRQAEISSSPKTTPPPTPIIATTPPNTVSAKDAYREYHDSRLVSSSPTVIQPTPVIQGAYQSQRQE